MNKAVLFYCIALIANFPSKSDAQFAATKVIVEAKYFQEADQSTYYDSFHGFSYSYDTSGASFSLIVASGLENKDDSVNYHYSARTTHTPTGKAYIEYDQDVLTHIDTQTHLLNMSANSSSEDHYNEINLTDYWNRQGEQLQVVNAPYRVTGSGDSLIVRLKPDVLRELLKTKSVYIGDYYTYSTTHTYGSSGSGEVIGIADSAFLNITIIGNFPLSVQRNSFSSKSQIVYDPASKTIILSAVILKQNLSLPCFDLIGRKRDLKFLGSDNTSATYSVRSLRPGVYFVNDGRETVKFMITE